METAHVIVVVNEPRTRQLLVDTLGREGVHVSVASSDKEGLALIERQRAQVLVADMDIRGMNDEFLRSAVSIQPRLALVALGSQSARAGSRWSQVARMDYLTKPLSGDAVRSALVSAAPLPRLETRGGIAAAARCCRAKGPAGRAGGRPPGCRQRPWARSSLPSPRSPRPMPPC